MGIPDDSRPGADTSGSDDDVAARTRWSPISRWVAIGPTRDAIAKLSARGVVAELVELAGFTHFQTPSYARPLTAVVPWLERVWSSAR